MLQAMCIQVVCCCSIEIVACDLNFEKISSVDKDYSNHEMTKITPKYDTDEVKCWSEDMLSVLTCLNGANDKSFAQ